MSITAEQPVIYTPNDNTTSNINSPVSLIIDTSDEKDVIDNEFQIIMLVDKSGSMNSIREDIICSINSVIENQKKISTENGVDVKFTLVTFNTHRSVVYNAMPMNEVELLTSDQYQTTGGTALYKSVINTLTENIHKTNVMAVIVTDGEDTSYDDIYTQQASSCVIESRKTTGWKFIYLSSDPTTVVQGINMGFQSNDQNTRSCNTNNVHVTYRKLGTALRRQCSAEISRARTTGSMHGLGKKLMSNTMNDEEVLWYTPGKYPTKLPYTQRQYDTCINQPILTRSCSMSSPPLSIPVIYTKTINFEPTTPEPNRILPIQCLANVITSSLFNAIITPE
jgi:hypothetical protein